MPEPLPFTETAVLFQLNEPSLTLVMWCSRHLGMVNTFTALLSTDVSCIDEVTTSPELVYPVVRLGANRQQCCDR